MTKQFKGQDVRIVDLVGPSMIIEDVVFEGCQIIGPAVVGPLSEDVEFRKCTFDASPNELFWPIPGGKIAGVVGLRRCVFLGCRFAGIGIVGSPESVKIWRQKLSPH